MTNATDQFSDSDQEFVTLSNQIYDELSGEDAPKIGVPATVFTQYKDLLTPTNDTWAIAKNKTTSTRVQRTAYKNNRILLTAFLRTFVQQWLYNNDAATTDIIQSTGLRLHSTSRTSHAGAPKDTPVAGVLPLTGHGLKAIVRNEEGKLAKPIGVGVIRARYFIGVGAPANPGEFPKFKDFTKSPFNLFLPAEDSGQMITIAFCYVSSTGAVEGNYCVVIVTKVP